jgi:hypothetical protein
MNLKRFKVGDRVVRARCDNARIVVGSIGTVAGYESSGTVKVHYDRWPKYEARQREENLEFLEGAELVREVAPPPLHLMIIPVADHAFIRDGFSVGGALALEEKLRAERSTVKPPRGAGRWTFRREWRKAAPTVHGAFMGLARILRGL